MQLGSHLSEYKWSFLLMIGVQEMLLDGDGDGDN